MPLFSIFAKCKAKDKGGQISESFTLWLKSPKKGAKSRPLAFPLSIFSLKIEDAQGHDLAAIFGDLT